MKREANYDCLRILAALLVIAIHVSGSFIRGNWGDVGVNNVDFPLENFYNSILSVAVPLFILLSGAFVLGADKNGNTKTFYNSHLTFILAVTILWNALYFVAGIASGYGVSAKEVLLSGRAWPHLWYMPLISGLYAVTPFLIKLKHKIGTEKFFAFGLLVFLSSMLGITNKWYFMFVPFTGYYILGDFLKNYLRPIPVRYGFMVYVVSAAGGLLAVQLTGIKLFVSANFLFVMMGAMGLFAAFKGLKCAPRRIVTNWAKYSLDIYLIHPIFVFGLRWIAIRAGFGIPHGYNLIWTVPLVVFVVFILSWLSSIIIYHPTRWFMRVALQPPIRWMLRLLLRAGDLTIKFFGKYNRQEA